MRNLYGIFGGLAIVGLCAHLAYEVVRIHKLVDAGTKMTLASERFERPIEGKHEILILGDSLAYGVGVDETEDSFAGALGMHFSDKSIKNNAEIGETIGSLQDTLDQKLTKRYERIYIIIGGNDIMRMHINIFASRNSLKTVILQASQQAEEIVLITTGNFKDVSLSPWLLRSVFVFRANTIRSAALELESEIANLDYIDLQSAGIETNEYKHLEAADGYHLNKHGIKKLLSVMHSGQY